MAREKTPEWEARLWSYVSSGDGENCPLYEKCEVRVKSGRCLEDIQDHLSRINAFIDKDELSFSVSEPAEVELIQCNKLREIFKLTEKLAQKYLEMGNIHSPPVPTVLIALCAGSRPVEIHEVPLKVYHGAIWRLKDRWVVHLNENDTPVRRRFSLFHEAFHILAHSKTTPVFGKIGSRRGSLNELMADQFAGRLMMPAEWAKEKWAEYPDIDKIAEIFEIPKPIAWLVLKANGLI